MTTRRLAADVATGDGFLAEFGSAVEAAECAVPVQERAVGTAPPSSPLIGLIAEGPRAKPDCRNKSIRGGPGPDRRRERLAGSVARKGEIGLEATFVRFDAIVLQQVIGMNPHDRDGREDVMRRNFEIQSRWASVVAVLGVGGALSVLSFPLT